MFRLYYKYILVVLFLSMASALFAQNVGINTTGAAPSANARLDLNTGNTSNNLGLIIPNVSLTSLTQFSAPIIGAYTTKDSGIMVYNTNAAVGSGVGYYYWNNTLGTPAWVSFASANGITTCVAGPTLNYIPIFSGSSVICNSVIYQASTSAVGVGTATPQNMLDVSGALVVGSGAGYAGTATPAGTGMAVQGQVGIGTSSPNASAALDLTNTTTNLGFLLPRMTALQISAISSPANGLIVFNTSTGCYQFYTTTTHVGWNDLACPCTTAPSTPGTISGDGTICASTTGYTYSVTAVTGATSYTWTVPANVGNITSGQGTNVITISSSYNAYGIGNSQYYNEISVTASNLCGMSAVTTTTVQVVPIHGTQVFISYGVDLNAPQTWQVPACVTQVTVKLWGGGGASSYSSGTVYSSGGAGGFVEGIMAVTPEAVYTVVVGNGGSSNGVAIDNYYGGGGQPGGTSPDAGGGGGRAAIQVVAGTDYVTAGGGGGAGYGGSAGVANGAGGGGGASTGGSGGSPTGQCSTTAATGGTQTAGGGAGSITYQILTCIVSGTATGSAGSYQQGGTGGTNGGDYGGGGGAGYYGGGGGGGENGGGGAGGSNYVANLTAPVTNSQGGSSAATNNPPNTGDANYISGVGVGPSSSSTCVYGGPGEVVITW